MQHRRDIQGLRAFAVLSVILYHFHIVPFSGGFVGVDVFFVISGYLMTTLITKDLQRGVFRFSKFFKRRFYRVFPGLLVTVATTFMVGLIVFPPQEFARQSGATVFSLLGASNIFFWWESGYFDAAAMLKPLLHTWSLSVEAQFYLFWPVCLVAIWRLRGELVLKAGVVVVTILSAAACVWTMRVDPTAAFFLAPFRLFEFGSGALAALFSRQRPKMRGVAQGGSLAAMAVLIVAVLTYTQQTPFPGLAALPPVAATACLIWLGPGTFVAHAISGRAIHFLGEISYSLYLVHWPVVVFVSYLYGPDLSVATIVVALIGVIFGSLALYYCVERPLRHRHAFGTAAPGLRRVKLATASVLAIAFLAPLHSWVNEGWIFRSRPDVRALNAINIESQKDYLWQVYGPLSARASFEYDHRPRVLVIGDSQAADFVNVLFEGGVLDDIDLVGRGINTLCNIPYLEGDALDTFLTEKNPFSIKDPTLVERCASMMSEAVRGPAWEDADVIVIAFAWRDTTLDVLETSFAQLQSRTATPIFAVGNKTFTKGPIELANRQGSTRGLSQLSRTSLKSWTVDTNRALKGLSGVGFIDMLATFCTTSRCRMIVDEGMPVFWDETHFTTWGARYVWAKGEEEIMRFLEERPRP